MLDEGIRSVRLSDRFSLEQVEWKRVFLLVFLWMSVKIPLAYHFRGNDNSENFVRLWGNLGRLKPRLWPTLLNVCGYILPVIILMRGRLRPVRFANYLYILPFWIAVMFYTGVILETRIYGELCPYVAVASVLLLESAAVDTRVHLQQRDELRSYSDEEDLVGT